jgi:hypothetical protein
MWRAQAGLILLGMVTAPLALGVYGLWHPGRGGLVGAYVGIAIGVGGLLCWIYVTVLWWQEAHAGNRPAAAGGGRLHIAPGQHADETWSRSLPRAIGAAGERECASLGTMPGELCSRSDLLYGSSPGLQILNSERLPRHTRAGTIA